MIISLFGKNSYLVHKRLLFLKSAFVVKNENSNVVDIDLEDTFDLKSINSNLQGGSGLFADKKMVILRNIFSLNTVDQKALLALLETGKFKNKDSLVVLMVDLSEKISRGALIGFLKKNSKVEEFKELSLVDLRKWIASEVKKRSEGRLILSGEGLDYFLSINTNDLWKIDREIEKLINYKDKGEIIREDVFLLCEGGIKVGIFDLVDAIGQGDKPRALRLKEQLIKKGENEFYIFSMIISQIRNLIKINACFRSGISSNEMISKKTTTHPFVVKKTMTQLRNFSFIRLKKIYNLASRIDKGSKSGDFSMKEILDYFIAKI